MATITPVVDHKIPDDVSVVKVIGETGTFTVTFTGTFGTGGTIDVVTENPMQVMPFVPAGNGTADLDCIFRE